MAAVLLAGGIFTRYTTFGHEIYAVGANVEAARLSGIPVGSRLILLYTVSGAMAGLAGVVYLARLNSAEAGIGTPLLLPAIAAVLIRGNIPVWWKWRSGWTDDRRNYFMIGCERNQPARHQLKLAAVGYRSNHFARCPDILVTDGARRASCLKRGDPYGMSRNEVQIHRSRFAVCRTHARSVRRKRGMHRPAISAKVLPYLPKTRPTPTLKLFALLRRLPRTS